MKKIALTGGIASGKSTIGQHYKNLGEHSIDLDDIAKEILPECISELTALFGTEAMADGSIDTTYIRQKVFASPTLRTALEQITHPRILKRMHDKIDTLNALHYQRVIIMVPLLYEKQLFAHFDRALVVSCTREVQYTRLLERKGMTRELATRILDAQCSNIERLKTCEHLPCTIIENTTSIEHLYTKLEHIVL